MNKQYYISFRVVASYQIEIEKYVCPGYYSDCNRLFLHLIISYSSMLLHFQIKDKKNA